MTTEKLQIKVSKLAALFGKVDSNVTFEFRLDSELNAGKKVTYEIVEVKKLSSGNYRITGISMNNGQARRQIELKPDDRVIKNTEILDTVSMPEIKESKESKTEKLQPAATKTESKSSDMTEIYNLAVKLPAGDRQRLAIKILESISFDMESKESKTEKSQTAKTQPAKTQPAATKTESKTEKSQPAKSQPAKSQPAKTQPAKTQPATAKTESKTAEVKNKDMWEQMKDIAKSVDSGKSISDLANKIGKAEITLKLDLDTYKFASKYEKYILPEFLAGNVSWSTIKNATRYILKHDPKLAIRVAMNKVKFEVAKQQVDSLKAAK